MSELTSSPAWKALQANYARTANVHMRDLFAKDAGRFDAFSVKFEDILLDYSKNRVTTETMGLLFALAEQAGVTGWPDPRVERPRVAKGHPHVAVL